MAVLEQSWNPEARILGYQHEREMLKDLYYEHGYSINQMARILGHSSFAVRRRLIMVGEPLRKRGGPNHTVRKLEKISDELLFKTQPALLAEVLKCHPATIAAEKKLRRQREKTKEVA